MFQFIRKWRSRDSVKVIANLLENQLFDWGYVNYGQSIFNLSDVKIFLYHDRTNLHNINAIHIDSFKQARFVKEDDSKFITFTPTESKFLYYTLKKELLRRDAIQKQNMVIAQKETEAHIIAMLKRK